MVGSLCEKLTPTSLVSPSILTVVCTTDVSMDCLWVGEDGVGVGSSKVE